MKRDIIQIEEEKCNGCGECIPNCPEGALQIIDGKARLISDLFCDGLGACIGHCPEEAITIIKRESEPYNERRVMENIVKQGENVIRAHLEHLKEHGEEELLNEALNFLDERGIEIKNPEIEEKFVMSNTFGCPGARAMEFSEGSIDDREEGGRVSHLTHWPIQLHLLSPMAPHYREKDLLLSADCVAYTYPEFHRDYLKGKSLAIACPKLDEGQEIYIEKLTALIDQAGVNTITVLIMEVPCCGGLLYLVQEAQSRAQRKVPVKRVLVSLKGEILEEVWV